MLRTPLLSLTALAVLLALFASSAQTFNSDIGELLVDLDTPFEEIESQLRELEKDVFELPTLSADNSSAFWLKFTDKDRLKAFDDGEVKDHAGLVRNIEALALKFKPQLVAGDFSEFSEAVRLPIRRHLISNIIAQGTNFDSNDLNINLANNLKTITNTLTEQPSLTMYAETISNYMGAVGENVMSVLESEIENFVGANIATLTRMTCLNEQDSSTYDSAIEQRKNLLNVLSIKHNSVDYKEVLASYLEQFFISDDIRSFNKGAACAKLIKDNAELLTKYMYTTNTLVNEDITYVLNKALSPRDSVYELTPTGNFDKFLHARQAVEHSNFAGLNSEDEVVRRVTAMHLLEFITNTFGINYVNDVGPSKAAGIYKISPNALKVLVGNVDYVIEVLEDKFEALKYIFNTFNNNYLNIKDETHLAKLIAFHNASLITKALIVEVGEVDANGDNVAMNDFMQDLLNKYANGTQTEIEGVTSELDQYYAIEPKKNYGYLITMMLMGTLKYQPVYADNGYDYGRFVAEVMAMYEKVRNNEAALNSSNSVDFDASNDDVFHYYLRMVLKQADNIDTTELTLERFAKILGQPIDRKHVRTEFNIIAAPVLNRSKSNMSANSSVNGIEYNEEEGQ